jgi:hypothetical protein
VSGRGVVSFPDTRYTGEAGGRQIGLVMGDWQGEPRAAIEQWSMSARETCVMSGR